MVTSLSKLYFIRGKETFLKRQYLKQIKSKFAEGASDWVNFETYFADEDDISHITSNASLFPSFNKYRVSTIKNIDKILKSSRKKLLDFLKNIPDKSVVILITSDKDSSNKFLTKLSKLKNIEKIKCKPLKKKQLYRWISKTVKEKSGKTISQGAVSMLIERTDTNLLNLNNEIDKLILYGRGENEIQVHHIDKLVKNNIEHNVFKLIDCICTKNINDITQIVDRMFTYRVSVIKIIGALAWQLRRMLRAHILMDAGYKPYQVTKRLGVNRYFADKFISQVNNFSLTDIKHAIKGLSYIDEQVKKSNIPEKLALETFIIDLIR